MSATMKGPRQVLTHPLAARFATVLAAAVLLLAGLTIAAIGLVAPAWAQWLLVIVWVVALERLVAWRRRPGLAIAVAVAMWVVLVGAIVVGGAWLGWTG